MAIQEINSVLIMNKLDALSNECGHSVSSMITLAIPPKYCI